MSLELCAFLIPCALALYLPTYSGDCLGKDFIILVFLFFILVILVKTACNHPRVTTVFLSLFFLIVFCVWIVSVRKLVLEKREAWSVSSQCNSVYFKVEVLLSAGRQISVMIKVDADATWRRAHLHINRHNIFVAHSTVGF